MSEHHENHVVSPLLYLAIFAALMVLTVVTVAASRFDFGPWNTVVAMAIAVLKATLVVLFFMHVKWSSRLVRVMVAAAFVWLAKGEDEFARQEIALEQSTSAGWITTQDWARGAKLVVGGAQSLLSLEIQGVQTGEEEQ